jgi:AraC-like DNA-binding protein
VQFITRPPRPALAPYVEAVWFCASEPVAHHFERVIPSGRSQLIVDLTDSDRPPVVLGLQTRAVVLDTAVFRRLVGVVFKAGGMRAIVGERADLLQDRVIPLDAIWPRAGELADRLREQATPVAAMSILESALVERLCERPLAVHDFVQAAACEFERFPHIARVRDVATAYGMSGRRFADLFREHIGLTPKIYCRVHRFQRVIRRIASGLPVNWSDVAHAGGYSDQPHLVHEFREFSGLSPTAYLASDRTHPNHVVVPASSG